MTDSATQVPTRVIWVSHGYGYGGDLMYFGEIFRAFREHVPAMAVAVDTMTQYRNPYDIALLPLMRLVRRKIRRTSPGGDVYETETTVPGPGLVWRLARWRPDVIIAIEFTPPALMAVIAAALPPARKLVLLIESDPAARGGSRNPLVLAVKRWAARRADVVQTNNPAGRRYAVEDLGVDPARLVVAPYLTSRPPGPEADTAPHAGPLRLLFANTIAERKGLGALLNALALLPADIRNSVDCTVVGDGPLRAGLEERAQGLEMGQRMRFSGRQAYRDLGAFYARADVLVIPSFADYRSLAGFEGLAYGLVLLASQFDGATAETVIEGQTGWTIDPGDPQAIADRIAALVRDRAMVTRMRAASLQRYHAQFSLERIAANLAQSVKLAIHGSEPMRGRAND